MPESYPFLLERLIRAPTWEDTRLLIGRAHALLHPEMDQVFKRALQDTDPTHERHGALIDHQQLLGLCRGGQTTKIFQDLTEPLEGGNALEKVFQLSEIEEPARCMLLCQRILTIIPEGQAEPLAAMLHHKKSVCLQFTPYGEYSENLEQALQQVQLALRIRRREVLPEEWAESTLQLAWLYYFRPKGDVAENKERAIASFDSLRSLWTRESAPERWSQATRHLALAAFHRIAGNRIHNIEASIDLFQQAMTVTTQEANPEEWASAAGYLALAYTSRGIGKREENLNKAIDLLSQALEIRKSKSLPMFWAETATYYAQALRQKRSGDRATCLDEAITILKEALEIKKQNHLQNEQLYTQNELALAYRDRINGDRAENLRQAISHWEEILQSVTPESNPFEWAGFMQDLSATYIDLPGENREENIEKAIMGLNQAIRIRTKEMTPENWANAMCSLAHAYANRLKGNMAKNREEALRYRKRALEIFSREQTPLPWAETMGQIGLHYLHRLNGSRNENITLAIHLWKQALEVFTFEEDMEIWGQIVNHLAMGYFTIRDGNRSQNLEKGRKALEDCLGKIDRKLFPLLWGQLNQNLACTYEKRLEGDRQTNLKKAHDHYLQGLEEVTPERNKVDWVTGMRNLADFYVTQDFSDREGRLTKAHDIYDTLLIKLNSNDDLPLWTDIKLAKAMALLGSTAGDPTENIEQALTHAEEARSALSPKDHSHLWIRAGVMMAEALRNRMRGIKSKNQKQAYDTLSECLEQQDFNFETQPDLWAKAMQQMISVCITWKGEGHVKKKDEGLTRCETLTKTLNADEYPCEFHEATRLLADAWSWRYEGLREENFEKAIENYQFVLDKVTKEKRPVFWAETMGNLAGAYRDRRLGSKSENHAKSAACYHQALNVFTLEIHPRYHHMYQGNLGRLHFFNRSWDKAYDAFLGMLKASELLYEAAPTLEARRAILHDNVDLAARSAYCLARMNRLEDAVVSLERHRTRTLAEMMAWRATPEHDPVRDQAIAAARREVLQLEAQLRLLPDVQYAAYGELSARMRFARQALSDLLRDANIEEKHLTYENIHALTRRSNRAVVFLSVPWLGGMALIVHPGQQSPRVIWLDEINGPDLRAMMENYDEEDQNEGYLKSISEWKENLAFLGEIWPVLQNDLMDPVVEELVRLGSNDAFLIPVGYLGLLPLHVMGGDRVAFAHIPSCRLLGNMLATLSAREDADPAILAIANPAGRKQLHYADLNTSVICRFFPEHHELAGTQATLQKMKELTGGTTHIHFACHGEFKPLAPLESHIELAGNESLSLNTALEGALPLDRVRLIFLAACQTGITDFKSVPDESFGFAAAFAILGVPAVITTLWPVEDSAATLLTLKFYQFLFPEAAEGAEEPLSPLRALAEAQKWLRSLTRGDLVDMGKGHMSLVPAKAMTPALESLIKDQEFNDFFDLDEKPYENPLYWAPFVLTGL